MFERMDIQVCSNEGPGSIQSEVKIRWGFLKILAVFRDFLAGKVSSCFNFVSFTLIAGWQS